MGISASMPFFKKVNTQFALFNTAFSFKVCGNCCTWLLLQHQGVLFLLPLLLLQQLQQPQQQLVKLVTRTLLRYYHHPPPTTTTSGSSGNSSLFSSCRFWRPNLWIYDRSTQLTSRSSKTSFEPGGEPVKFTPFGFWRHSRWCYYWCYCPLSADVHLPREFLPRTLVTSARMWRRLAPPRTKEFFAARREEDLSGWSLDNFGYNINGCEEFYP